MRQPDIGRNNEVGRDRFSLQLGVEKEREADPEIDIGKNTPLLSLSR